MLGMYPTMKALNIFFTDEALEDLKNSILEIKIFENTYQLPKANRPHINVSFIYLFLFFVVVISIMKNVARGQ